MIDGWLVPEMCFISLMLFFMLFSVSAWFFVCLWCVSSRGCRLSFNWCKFCVSFHLVTVVLSTLLRSCHCRCRCRCFCSLLVLHACSSCFLLFAVGASSVIGRRLSSKLTLHSAIRFQHLVTSTGVKVTHQATYAS